MFKIRKKFLRRLGIILIAIAVFVLIVFGIFTFEMASAYKGYMHHFTGNEQYK